jgi:hypothetical protein
VSKSNFLFEYFKRELRVVADGIEGYAVGEKEHDRHILWKIQGRRENIDKLCPVTKSCEDGAHGNDAGEGG